MVFADLVDAAPLIRTPTGRRRKRPITLHADTAYNLTRCRRFLRTRHITVRIARRGIGSSLRLGRHRWVVERTLAWLNRYRRLTIRYEQRADIHRAFPALGCALICFDHVPPPEGIRTALLGASTAAFTVIVVHRMTGMTAYDAATSRAASGADATPS